MTLEDINKKGYVIISSKDLNMLIKQASSNVKKMILSKQEVKTILNIRSDDKFYKHINSMDCLIRPSAKRGKYVASSVYAEADRLNNF